MLTWEHRGATGEDDISIELSSDVYVTFLYSIVDRSMDAIHLQSNEFRIEDNLINRN